MDKAAGHSNHERKNQLIPGKAAFRDAIGLKMNFLASNWHRWEKKAKLAPWIVLSPETIPWAAVVSGTFVSSLPAEAGERGIKINRSW